MSKDKAPAQTPGSIAAEPADRTPAGLRATANRIDQRKDGGFFVPGSAAGVYAEAMRALAREREQGQK